MKLLFLALFALVLAVQFINGAPTRNRLQRFGFCLTPEQQKEDIETKIVKIQTKTDKTVAEIRRTETVKDEADYKVDDANARGDEKIQKQKLKLLMLGPKLK
ncbi:uncharacterized protein LOC129574521 [Sitodiplosis mosellana]|uniref:uncharacterized protein LOC129574521 n=1 Tax=Sitodiplosis mosellana TaxID=263140 RepID=UPI0024440A9F|nr:uncharacterized protein LOC129574521 [Sitodiplosis mosellana]